MMDSKCFVQLVQSRLAASIRRKGKAFNGIISNAAHHTAHVDHDGLTLLKILQEIKTNATEICSQARGGTSE